MSDRVDLNLSVGAFENEQLMGFLLHGFEEIQGKGTLYNAGTGIVPKSRDKGLTKHLYSFIDPILNQRQIDTCILEVIDKNLPAIHAYGSVGFKVVRELDCFKGNVSQHSENETIEIKEIDKADWAKFQSFWDWTPTWQNSPNAFRNGIQPNKLDIAYHSDLVVGYALYHPYTGRVHQFAVDPSHRRKGIGRKLFSHIGAQAAKELSTINVDGADMVTHHFLQSIGLDPFIKQLEMMRGW